jgi:aminoglycoside phosphotransferase (APT) family kinase protein
VAAPALADIERALEHAFRELEIAPLRPLETGFGSTAVETAGSIVFRIPRHRGSADGHATEARALPSLGARLPARVPNPEWRLEPGHADFPLGVIGYRKIPGTTPAPGSATDELAADLARFLAALHAFPLDEAESLGLQPGLPPRDAFESERDAVLPVLREALRPREYRVVVRWWDDLLADAAMHEFAPALRHGDPWYGNVIVDESRRLAGVVDWEGLEIGDPAWDFAAQSYLGRRFFDRVLELAGESRGDATLARRARRLAEVREFGGIRLSVAVGDDAELEDAIAKLRRSSVLFGVL